MRLYLVQHGDAELKEVDPDRPLTAVGAGDVKRMATFLRGRQLSVSAIWHSGKTRAAQTAELLSEAFAAEGGIRQRDGLAPNDPVGPVRRAVEAAGADLMIVGHLPFLGKHASLLLTGEEATGAVALR